MKRKKGFIFIETLVVVAVLTVSLLMTYSTYNSAIIKEKIRIRYNDSAYMYRTYYLTQFFRNFRLDILSSSLSPEMPIQGFNCQNESIFINEMDNKGMCEQLFSTLHIHNIYLTYNDLSVLQNCEEESGICEVLLRVSSEMAGYLKTIGGDSKSGYRIIVEYAFQKNGDQCYNDTNCVYYYTTLSLGEI